jgi:hypothetical protein
MTASKTNKIARSADTTTFPSGYLDESGTGVGPFDPTVAHVDSTGALINPAKDETIQAANAKLDTLHSDLAALLSADAGLASASGQTAANTKLDTLHTDIQTLAGEEGALGAQADAPWSGTGSGGIVGVLKAIWAKLGGTLVVSGATAVGSAPTNPPISVSGVDGSGNKRHLLTDTTGAFVVAQPSSIATNQVSVGTAATLICAARAGRKAITIIQEGTTLVRLGASGVTVLTGIPLPGTQYASFTIDGGAAVYGIVASGSQTVSYAETF